MAIQRFGFGDTRQTGIAAVWSGLAYTQNLHDKPGTYDVIANNCVDKVIAAAAAANVKLPHDTKPETFGWDLINSK